VQLPDLLVVGYLYRRHREAAGEAISTRWSRARQARGDMLTMPHPAALAQGGLGRGATASAPWDVPRTLLWQPPAAGGPGLPAAGPAPSAAAAAAAAMANAAAAAAAAGSAPSAAPARRGGVAGAAAASEGDDSPERPEAPETDSESSGPEGTAGGSAGTATGSAEAAGSAEAPLRAAPAAARFTEGDLEAVAGLVGLQTIARTAPPEPPQRLFLFEQLTRLDRRAVLNSRRD